ncbi:hypothetical protein C882_0908 [Caenispirillum salinarum AK4]|uniref:Uncharacterized protein n=1 Tax=Caenispirillum salinarum AK4 TaxID=1238182 RepID=K9HJC8_9PROT|nr:hypothetical protein C882_0908 [Caenispirillum salinarum AK4]
MKPGRIVIYQLSSNRRVYQGFRGITIKSKTFIYAHGSFKRISWNNRKARLHLPFDQADRKKQRGGGW